MELYEHKYAKIEFQHRCRQSGCRHRAVNINLQVKSETQRVGAAWKSKTFSCTSAVFMSVEDRVSVTGAGSPPRVQAGLL